MQHFTRCFTHVPIIFVQKFVTLTNFVKQRFQSKSSKYSCKNDIFINLSKIDFKLRVSRFTHVMIRFHSVRSQSDLIHYKCHLNDLLNKITMNKIMMNKKTMNKIVMNKEHKIHQPVIINYCLLCLIKINLLAFHCKNSKSF